MKKKLCYVISDVDTGLVMDANIRFLDRDKYDLTTIFLNASEPGLYKSLSSDGFDVRYVYCGGKKNVPPLIASLYRLFGELKPRIVHTHLFFAAIAGLTAARLRKIETRINTRHHSTEAHVYHPHAVWYDRYVNTLSTHTVAITDSVKRILVEEECIPADRVTVVHHGFDMRLFEAARMNGDLKEKYGLSGHSPIIGVISRFIHWKGLQYVIPAFRQLLNKFPNAKLVLANAEGSYEPEVRKLLKEIEPEHYRLIPFETDVLALYKSFDVLVHAPIGPNDEAFGQVYVEALAMGIPSVFTLSGVARDFVRDRQNALVVPFQDAKAISAAIEEILEHKDLALSLGEQGRESVIEKFSIQSMVASLDAVYSSAVNGHA